MSKIILTDEQREIIAINVPKGKILKISAFAGTGKTSTLRAFVEAHPFEHFLYICYNSSVSQDAKGTFPSNCECRTTHSLAHKSFGKLYENKMLFNGSLKPYILTDHLGIKEYGMGKYLIDVLVKFLASADPEINPSHLILNHDLNEDDYLLQKDEKTIQYLIKKANQLWEKMQDPDNKKIPMIHDGYLKLFQLSKPQLDYDYILLDEAHDTNPVVLDLFLNQKAAKIIVGDSHQSCYGFRHAYDAMTKVDGDFHHYLSNSFRFGNNIARVANLILKKMKKEKKELKGVGPEGKIGWVDTDAPYTIIARTNGKLFDQAAALIGSGQSFGWVGTSSRDNFNPFNHYYFNRILDVYRLYANEKHRIKDKYIKRFNNFRHFIQVIEDKDAPDIELQSRASVVEKYKEKIPLLVDTICQNSVDPKKAHVTFTTAHRSKGLEFPQVKLIGDFADLVIEGLDGTKRLATTEDEDEQEFNLLYISATRAKNVLQINRNILSLIEYEKNKRV